MASKTHRPAGWIGLFILSFTTAAIAQSPAQRPSAATASASGAVAGNTYKLPSKPEPFVLIGFDPWWAQSLASGAVTSNLMYEPGGWQTLLKRLKEARPKEGVNLFQCTGPQIDTLREFAPVADHLVVWPFVAPGDKKPVAGERLWPGVDHPIINRIREMRNVTQGTQLLAAMHPGRPSSNQKYWGLSHRSCTYEELEWMVCAIVGCNWNGILWQQDFRTVPWYEQRKRLEQFLQAYAKELGGAAPVTWVKCSGGQPAAAVCSANVLLVVMLNPEYMKVGADGKTISVPLDPQWQRGGLAISPPEGISIVKVEDREGKAMEVRRDGRNATVNYRFHGGGEILVVTIESAKALSAANSSKDGRTSR